ncbi:MAG: sulfotransferase domain-containing protein [Proteobacteria bacterium]|nr:sulfotransferase domain-containing protein [Pseudomonadota bacterium]
MLPTFIIAGAGKSGTTTLWSQLNTHPQVCMARIKEPAFFSEIKGMNEGGGPGAPTASGSYSRGLAWYESLFTAENSHRAFGEASTLYMHAPDAAGLIRRHIPSVRLVFILRDPVARMYSQYWQERKAGMRLPDFDAMLDAGHPRMRRYAYNSHYREHLERFLAIFPRSQILILFSERLRTLPGTTFDEACTFIGVEPGLRTRELGRSHNTAALPRWPTLQRLLKSPACNVLRVTLHDGIKPPLRAAVHLLRQTNIKDFDYPPLAPAQKDRLIPIFQDDISFVEQLANCSLSHWRKVA